MVICTTGCETLHERQGDRLIRIANEILWQNAIICTKLSTDILYVGNVHDTYICMHVRAGLYSLLLFEMMVLFSIDHADC